MRKCTSRKNIERIDLADIIIVIPVYSEKLNSPELASLRQVKRVLKHYKICFVAPSRMRKFLLSRGYIAEFFKNEMFESVETYSELLLTPEFYNRFIQYKYMLIYQLDAFVFSDKLLDFCQLGYDYIGAPWKRYDFSYLNVKVGNGGFCLRRIEACKRMVENGKLLNDWRNSSNDYLLAEDQFFAYCAGRNDVDFYVPEAKEALEFSVEKNLCRCYQNLHRGWLPFGCHGWTKPYFFPIWYTVMEKLLPDFKSVALFIESSGKLSYTEHRLQRLDKYLVERMGRYDKKKEVRHVVADMPMLRKIMNLSGIYIWGNGHVSNRACLLLELLGCQIMGSIDRLALKKVNQQGISILTPQVAPFVQPKCIVITTIKYAEEIAEQLDKWGFKHGEEYFYYRELERAVVLGYYGVGVGKDKSID